MNTIIENMAMLFIIVGVGYAAEKTGVLSSEAKEYLSTLMLSIASPCLIVDSMIYIEMSNEILHHTVSVLIGVTFLCGAFFVLSYAFGKVLCKQDISDEGVYMALITSVNSGFIGLPIAKAILGMEGLYMMAIANIVCNIFLYSVCIMQINYKRGKKSNRRKICSLLVNPNIIASIIGIAIMMTGIELPHIMESCIKEIGDITVPLSMIIIGISFGEGHMSNIIKNRKLWIIGGLKMIVVPLIVLGTVLLLDIYEMTKWILVFVSGLPSAIALGPLTERLGKNTQLASEGVILTTFISFLILPFLTVYLSRLFLY